MLGLARTRAGLLRYVLTDRLVFHAEAHHMRCFVPRHTCNVITNTWSTSLCSWLHVFLAACSNLAGLQSWATLDHDGADLNSLSCNAIELTDCCVAAFVHGKDEILEQHANAIGFITSEFKRCSSSRDLFHDESRRRHWQGFGVLFGLPCLPNPRSNGPVTRFEGRSDLDPEL